MGLLFATTGITVAAVLITTGLSVRFDTKVIHSVQLGGYPRQRLYRLWQLRRMRMRGPSVNFQARLHEGLPKSVALEHAQGGLA